MKTRTLLVAALLAASACSTDTTGDSSGQRGCPAGSERCACYGNNSCDDGLVCASDVCVALGQDGGSSGAAGSMGAETDASSPSDTDAALPVEMDAAVADNTDASVTDADVDAEVVADVGTALTHEMFIGDWDVVQSNGVTSVWHINEVYGVRQNNSTTTTPSTGFDGDVLLGQDGARFWLTSEDTFEGSFGAVTLTAIRQ